MMSYKRYHVCERCGLEYDSDVVALWDYCQRPECEKVEARIILVERSPKGIVRRVKE